MWNSKYVEKCTARPKFSLLSTILHVHVFLIYLNSVENVNAQDDVLTLEAVGSTARLGELYNYDRDEFTQVSIFNKKIPPEYIARIGTPRTEVKYGMTQKVSDRGLLVGISGKATLKGSVGVVNGAVIAGASFLVGGAKVRNKVTAAVTFKTETEREILEIFYDDLANHISQPILDNAKDSHVVVGIGYGADFVVQFEDKTRNDSAILQGKGILEANLKALFLDGALAQLFPNGIPDIPGLNKTGFGLEFGIKSQINTTIKIKKSFRDLSMSIYGDVFMHGVDYPTDAGEVLNLIRQVPKLVHLSNDGRGKQMVHFLMPIERIRKFMKTVLPKFTCSCGAGRTAAATSDDENDDAAPRTGSKSSSSSFSPSEDSEIPEGTIDEALRAIENSIEVHGKLSDLELVLRSSQDFINSTALIRLRTTTVIFLNRTRIFKKAVAAALEEARRNKTRAESDDSGKDKLPLEKIVQNFLYGDPKIEGDLGLYEIERNIEDDYLGEKLKVALVEAMRADNVTWVGRGAHYLNYIMEDFKESFTISACVFHYYNWYLDTVLDFVLRAKLAKKEERVHVYVVDCDFEHPTCELMTSKKTECENVFNPAVG